MRLPTPRDPECSVSHTAPAVSSASSMKWLPPPSVPSANAQFLSYWSGVACVSEASCSSVLIRAEAVGVICLLFLPALIGMRRSMPARMAAGSLMSDRVSGVRTAIIPQPMSTPTAAGMTAPVVASTVPTVAPLP